MRARSLWLWTTVLGMSSAWAMGCSAPTATFQSVADEAAPMEPAMRQASPVAVEAEAAGLGGLMDAEAPPPPPEGGPQDDAFGGEAAAALGEAEAPESEVRMRSWFPEAFLWQPLVETDASGRATVDVRVPDQLTTWRILALAHDRHGQQSGTVHTFDSRLPVYVDPVVPGYLMAGDRVQLPVQVVNQTPGSVSAQLSVEASGAMEGAGQASISLTAGSSDVRTLPFTVQGAGLAKVKATLSAGADSDAAERTIPVSPSGRPVVRRRGSTLSSTRTLTLTGPSNADRNTEELHVMVFPGPLAVVQAELERLQAGARPMDGAYGFAIASHFATLAARTGVALDASALRKLKLVAWQRIVREARAPDAGRAADLLTSLRGVEGEALVDELRPRLVQRVVRGQRADGTWSRVGNSTLQRVLVETAVAAGALDADDDTVLGPRLRAAGAIERYYRDVEDGYTASVLLASGMADGPIAEHLRGLVGDNLTTGPTGAVTVGIPDGVRNAWGLRPSRAEVLAWTVLALEEAYEGRGDLVSELMSGWGAHRGFGAGYADGVALQAIVQALPGTTQKVTVTLEVDGEEGGEGAVGSPAAAGAGVAYDSATVGRAHAASVSGGAGIGVCGHSALVGAVVGQRSGARRRCRRGHPGP